MLDQELGAHGHCQWWCSSQGIPGPWCESQQPWRGFCIHTQSCLASVQPAASADPMLGKERDYRLLVPMAVSHLLPLQEMSPRLLWDMQSLLCCPWQPPHPAGLTLTCTELSPKAPGKHHTALEANPGILLPVEVFSSCGAAPQSMHCPVHPGSVKWLMLSAVHGIYLVQIAEGLGFNVHWKDIGTRFWTALCSLPWWTKQILYHEREEEAETWNNVPVCLTACCCSWCWAGASPALLGERSRGLWLWEDEPVVIWQGWWERKGRLILARWEMLSQCEKSVHGGRLCSEQKKQARALQLVWGNEGWDNGYCQETPGLRRKLRGPSSDWKPLL